MTRPAASYVVERIRWTDPGLHGPLGERPRRLPAASPVASFATSAEAEAERRRLERAGRQGVNPFEMGGAGPVLPDEPRRRAPKRLAARPRRDPAGPARGWPRRLAGVVGRARRCAMTDEQRESVWGLLDRLKLFTVAKVKVEG
jgi:hypothetical protein